MFAQLHFPIGGDVCHVLLENLVFGGEIPSSSVELPGHFPSFYFLLDNMYRTAKINEVYFCYADYCTPNTYRHSR